MAKKTLSQIALDIVAKNYNDPGKADKKLEELLKQKNNEMPIEQIKVWHKRKSSW